MRVLLINDTGLQPHPGCQAVQAGLRRFLKARGIALTGSLYTNELKKIRRRPREAAIEFLGKSIQGEMIRASDAIVINGEGTFHHGRCDEYLALVAFAKAAGKAVYFVNALVEDYPAALDMLRSCDGISVRDRTSAAYLADNGIEAVLRPDAFVWAPFAALDLPVVPFVETIVTDWHREVADVSGVAIHGFLERHWGRTWFHAFDSARNGAAYPFLLAMMRTGGQLLTARYHGAVAAVMAGRPVALLPSNSHKMAAFAEEHVGLDALVGADERPERALARMAEREADFAAAGRKLRRLATRLDQHPLAGLLARPSRPASADAGLVLRRLQDTLKRGPEAAPARVVEDALLHGRLSKDDRAAVLKAAAKAKLLTGGLIEAIGVAADAGDGDAVAVLAQIQADHGLETYPATATAAAVSPPEAGANRAPKPTFPQALTQAPKPAPGRRRLPRPRLP
ncbi:polysaccharide pyruvyl transferase family protein [Methylobrevis pamukkalensis]|uniref:Polysaccharide pyruvyl transferase n=1 Tax=Methylobrevis pamukkalensis TaxID=1439726 RepID=A0A1E3GX98_9HYPH|nr:polysaccharide pyruvyl transferase family protein [Methylobrevis pamukkalensis]ODN68565.1 Polysaccharide pyruvyl transferase [Methylobrevis pamukkalensis]